LARHRTDLLAFIDLRLDARLQARLDVEDIVQEVHMEAFRRLDDYLLRRPMPFRDWLRKTAYDRLLMLRRQHVFAARRSVYREVQMPDKSSLVLAQRLFATGSTPSQQMDRKELARRVRAALTQLTDAARDVLLMRNYEEMSYTEIGDIMSIDAAAARKRHGRALIRLHQLLSDNASED
jgi:RNA polymerase sigma-70 factor (ECF subfamily)